MAKNRKTREQKKLSDLRHNFKHQIVNNTFEVKTSSIKIETKTPSAIHTLYPYLIKDLTKTLTLTTAIIAVQIILFAILKNHLITIPNLIY